MSGITVRKYSWNGEFRYEWSGVLLLRTPQHLVLEAVWDGPGEPRVDDICFCRGDRFIEHYYYDRSYAIWKITQADGILKGWYCNINTPVREHAGILSFQDLLLDVVVYPDGRYTVLDAEEFDQAQQAGLPQPLIQLAETALAAVQLLIQNEAAPFSFSHKSPSRNKLVSQC